ncbi:MAG: hypothetical protein IPN42_00425 [Methylococcaceae bacterium]|nr:hypothetical protein [Methylococcaceae bacterium]
MVILVNRIIRLALVFSLLHTAESSAWEQIRCIAPMNKGLKKHWKTMVYKPVIDPVTIPEGSPQYFAILEALDRMNRNPSNFRYEFGGMDNNDGIAANNGESEISMQDLGPDFSKNSAVESSDSDYSPTCTATESDIVINTHYRMNRPPNDSNKLSVSKTKNQLFAYGGSYASLVSTVMHELGHSAGLHHECDVLNLMGGNNLLTANGNEFEPYIGEDAATGLITLFGRSVSALEDVSLSHWRYGDKLAAKDGSIFSIHHRTRVFDSNKNELKTVCPYINSDLDGPPISNCPEPVYRVVKGQPVNIELTYENAGKTTPVSIEARYYLSNDNKIDQSDTLIKTRTYSIKRDGKPSTFTTTLIIPKAVISSRDYWLGCVIKLSQKNLIESNEADNRTYVGIKVD